MIWNDFWLSVIVYIKGRCEDQLWRLWSPWPIFHRSLWKDNLCGTDGEKMEWGKNKLEKKKNPTKIIKGGNREKRRRHGPGSLKSIRLGLETSHKGYSTFEGSLCCYNLHLHSLGYERSTSHHWNWKTFILLGLTLERSALKLFTVANKNYLVILRHRRTSSVSLETYPRYF